MAGLLDIPGYGGFLQQGQLNDQQAQRRLQGVLGALQVAQGIEGMQDAPLKRQMLQAQVQGVLAQQRQQEEVNKLIGSLPQEQQALARIAPQQFVGNLMKAQEAAAGRQQVARLASSPGQMVMAPANDVTATNPTVNVGARPGVLSAFFDDPNIGPAARQIDKMAGEGGYADIKDFNSATDALMKLAAASASKPPGAMTERAFQKLQRYQDMVDSGQQLTQAQIRDAEASRAILSRQEMRTDPVTNRPYFVQPIQIPDSLTVGRTGGGSGPSGAGGAAGIPVNQVPATQGGRRPLDQKDEDALANLGKGYSQMRSLISEASPQHFGFGLDVAGDLATAVGRRVPDSRFGKTAEWWQRYEDWVADIRKERFGATLTGNELANFEKYKVKASDTPEIAAANLKRQTSILEGAAARKLNSLNQSGVNMGAAEALIGPMVSPQEAEAVQANPSPMFAGKKAIPQGAINDLKMNPKSAAQFDTIFGAGAAAKILGK